MSLTSKPPLQLFSLNFRFWLFVLLRMELMGVTITHFTYEMLPSNAVMPFRHLKTAFEAPCSFQHLVLLLFQVQQWLCIVHSLWF